MVWDPDNPKGSDMYDTPYQYKNCSPDKRECKNCGHDIYWAKSKNGKNIACDPDGICHWEDGRCSKDRDPIKHDPEIHKYHNGNGSSQSSGKVSQEVRELGEAISLLRDTLDEAFKRIKHLSDLTETRHQKMRTWAASVEKRLKGGITDPADSTDVPETGVADGDRGEVAPRREEEGRDDRVRDEERPVRVRRSDFSGPSVGADSLPSGDDRIGDDLPY